MTAHRRFFDTQSLTKELKVIAGSFAPAGSDPVTDVVGKGFSVARTDTGEFTITLEDKYVDLIAGIANVQLNAAADVFLQLGAYDADAKTLIVNAWDISGTGLADISANANNRVNFTLYLQNTKLKGR